MVKKIKVGGHTYKIIPDYNFKAIGNDLDGTCNHYTYEIRISERFNNLVEARETTLIHELLHAISIVYNCGLNEGQVTSLAEGLFQVMKDNYGFNFSKDNYNAE